MVSSCDHDNKKQYTNTDPPEAQKFVQPLPRGRRRDRHSPARQGLDKFLGNRPRTLERAGLPYGSATGPSVQNLFGSGAKKTVVAEL